jgi:signal transduction histidine kinase
MPIANPGPSVVAMTALSLSPSARSAGSDPRRLRISIRDVIAGLLVSAWGIYVVHRHPGTSRSAAAGMLLVGLPILLCRWRPLVALALVVAGIWVNGLVVGVDIRCSAELPAFGYVLFEAVRSSRTRHHRVMVAVCCVAFLLGENAYDPIMTWGGGLELGIVIVLAMAAAGEVVRRRDLEVSRLQADIVALHAQREATARVATEAERLRIKTGLVVEVETRLAAIRAGIASAEAALTDGDATAGFVAIEELGRDTLVTMRASLGALRGNSSTGVGVGTLPVLADLKTLLADLDQPATLRLEGQPRPLGAALELTAYRIVELVLAAVDPERAPVGVVLTYGPSELELRLNGHAAAGRAAAAAASLRAARVRATAVGGSVSCSVARGLLTASSRLPLESTRP